MVGWCYAQPGAVGQLLKKLDRNQWGFPRHNQIGWVFELNLLVCCPSGRHTECVRRDSWKSRFIKSRVKFKALRFYFWNFVFFSHDFVCFALLWYACVVFVVVWLFALILVVHWREFLGKDFTVHEGFRCVSCLLPEESCIWDFFVSHHSSLKTTEFNSNFIVLTRPDQGYITL